MKEKLIIVVIASLLSACASHRQQDIDTTNLEQLQRVYTTDAPATESSADANRLRYKMLQDTAMGLGAQAGLAATYEQIDINLDKDKKYLESLFNFNGMMLSHGVLPPVLVQGDNSLNLADPNTIRVADKTYKIVAQARFATTPPNWRDYLWQSYSKPEMPHKSLLPKTKEERLVWGKYIKLGWDRGVEQAHNIFQQNLARLKRDYQGMILYRKLLQEKMITPPFVSKTELGVTGNGENMRINDQVLRITEHPQLQTDSQDWRAIVVKQDE